MKNILKNIKTNYIEVDNEHFLFNWDCLEVLKGIPDSSVKLVVTDPPYNINLKYNTYNDSKTSAEYYWFLQEVCTELKRVLTDDGSLYLINYPEMNARMLPFLEDDLGMVFKRWITWHYPTNIGHSKTNYTRSQRSILFFSKNKKHIFNKPLQPYKNPNVTKVKKLIEQGKWGRWSYDTLEMKDLIEIFTKAEVQKDIMEDVINFNLLKNTAHDRAWDDKVSHPCQLPLSLLKVFIKASSDEWDIVLDAFAWTFTTSKAAQELNRKSIWIELDKSYVDLWFNRLKND